MAYKLQQNVKREEKCARTAPFPLPPSPSAPPHSPSLSLYSPPLCCVSETAPLFYQINISQNKSQDNFKLASERREEWGRKERERDGGGGGSRSDSCEVESLSFRSPLFSGLWFLCLLSSWSQLRLCDEVVTAAYESQMKGKSASFRARTAALTYCIASKE